MLGLQNSSNNAYSMLYLHKNYLDMLELSLLVLNFILLVEVRLLLQRVYPKGYV